MNFQKTENASFLTGNIRTFNEDFQVDEIPDFTPSGEGEHACLKVKKLGQNTEWTGKQLADIAGVERRNVSYAGLKDRHAVTTQWFSVWLPGKPSPDWSAHLPDSIQVIEEVRHSRKVRIGTLKGNRFKIIIRDCIGNKAALAATLENIRQQGVPNYFGAQRFGRDQHNIHRATAWFSGEIKPKARHQKSMYLSAARSWIFNHYLSERITEKNWNSALDGDVFQLDGSNSCFYEQLTEVLSERVQMHDLHPTGPLWGAGEAISGQGVAAAEARLAAEFQLLCAGLERHGLKQERRSLRLLVNDLGFQWLADDVLELRFTLKPGSYATSVLQELGDFSDASEPNKSEQD